MAIFSHSGQRPSRAALVRQGHIIPSKNSLEYLKNHDIFADEALVPKLFCFAWIAIYLFLIAGFQTRLTAI